MIFVIGLVAFGISAVGTVGSILGNNFCVGMGDITDSMTPEQKAQYEMLPESVKEQFAENLQSSLSSMPCKNVFGLGFMGTIAFFIGVFGLPSILGITIAMWTHARPVTQIFCSQQLTDELRAKFSKPVRARAQARQSAYPREADDCSPHSTLLRARCCARCC